jgi:GNAT superfamily N-acetyltransferase
VLGGAAPVLWVHGDGSARALSHTLAGSPEVADVYVASDCGYTLDLLRRDGWQVGESLTQLSCDAGDWIARPSTSGRVRELGVMDLPAFRQTLASASGAQERLLASSYGDDFFERAKPAWLFGAYDGDVLVGTVGLRRQHQGAMVFALAVAPAHRRTGTAQELTQVAVARAFLAGAAFVHALAEPASVGVGLAVGGRPVGTWQHLSRPA